MGTRNSMPCSPVRACPGRIDSYSPPLLTFPSAARISTAPPRLIRRIQNNLIPRAQTGRDFDIGPCIARFPEMHPLVRTHHLHRHHMPLIPRHNRVGRDRKHRRDARTDSLSMFKTNPASRTSSTSRAASWYERLTIYQRRSRDSRKQMVPPNQRLI